MSQTYDDLVHSSITIGGLLTEFNRCNLSLEKIQLTTHLLFCSALYSKFFGEKVAFQTRAIQLCLLRLSIALLITITLPRVGCRASKKIKCYGTFFIHIFYLFSYLTWSIQACVLESC